MSRFVGVLGAALLGIAATVISTSANADCALNAQSRESVTVLDRHTILLSGGRGPDILVRTLAAVNRRAAIAVVRNNFCSFALDVLVVDNEFVGVGRVTVLR